MKPNMNFRDIFIHYMIMMVVGIIGGLMGSLPVMLIGMFFFFCGITGWSPIFSMLGINHDTKEMNP